MERNENGNNIEELDLVIDKKLKKFNLKPLTLQDRNMVDYLRRIENAIQSYENERCISIEKYKSCKINHLKVSQATGISRVTIITYKNLLGEYIDKSVEIQKMDDIFENIKELKHNINSLMDVISKMQIRDVVIENQSIEIEELKKNLVKFEEAIVNSNIRNEQLIKELNESRKDINSYKIRRI